MDPVRQPWLPMVRSAALSSTSVGSRSVFQVGQFARRPCQVIVWLRQGRVLDFEQFVCVRLVGRRLSLPSSDGQLRHRLHGAVAQQLIASGGDVGRPLNSKIALKGIGLLTVVSERHRSAYPALAYFVPAFPFDTWVRCERDGPLRLPAQTIGRPTEGKQLSDNALPYYFFRFHVPSSRNEFPEISAWRFVVEQMSCFFPGFRRAEWTAGTC